MADLGKTAERTVTAAHATADPAKGHNVRSVSRSGSNTESSESPPSVRQKITERVFALAFESSKGIPPFF